MEGASRNVKTRVLIHILPASDNGQVSLDLGEIWCSRGVFVCKGGAGGGGKKGGTSFIVLPLRHGNENQKRHPMKKEGSWRTPALALKTHWLLSLQSAGGVLCGGDFFFIPSLLCCGTVQSSW